MITHHINNRVVLKRGEQVIAYDMDVNIASLIDEIVNDSMVAYEIMRVLARKDIVKFKLNGTVYKAYYTFKLKDKSKNKKPITLGDIIKL